MSGGGVAALPTAEELADVYSEETLRRLYSLAGSLDEHDIRALLGAALRTHQKMQLLTALNPETVRRKRAVTVRLGAEIRQQGAALRVQGAGQVVGFYDQAAAPPFGFSEQSASPSE